MSVVNVLIVGFLGVQIIGIQAGAVYDLNNVVVAVTTPRTPLLQIMATAALNGLIVYALTLGAKRVRRDAVVIAASFSIATSLLILASFLITPTRGPDGQLPVGVAVGWEGWLQEGGINPSIHLVLIVAVGAWWHFHKAQRPATGQASPSQQWQPSPDAQKGVAPQRSDGAASANLSE